LPEMVFYFTRSGLIYLVKYFLSQVFYFLKYNI
jgi:hypothetical protein